MRSGITGSDLLHRSPGQVPPHLARAVVIVDPDVAAAVGSRELRPTRWATFSRSVTDRFWSKVDRRGPDECWPWTGARTPRGAGNFRLSNPRRVVRAYVYAWEPAYGPVPAGYELHHRCEHPWCCNPTHLELRTSADRDRAWAGKAQRARTHCPQGHEYTPENTWVYRGRRYCRTCRRERERARKSRLKAAT
jgi:hypothetical protein